jgi:hypothetical protein
MHDTVKNGPQFRRDGSRNIGPRGGSDVCRIRRGEAGANETSFKSASHRVTPVQYEDTIHQTILISTS